MGDFQKNKLYRMMALYVVLFFAAVIVLLVCAFRINKIFDFISYVITALTPVLIGFVIAYLLSPAVAFFEKKIFTRVLKKSKKRVQRLFGIITVYMLLFLFLALILLLLVPQLALDYKELLSHADEYILFAENFADKMLGSTGALSELLGGLRLGDYIGEVIVDSFLFADRFLSFALSFASSFISIAVMTVFSLIASFGLLFYSDIIAEHVRRVSDDLFSDRINKEMKNALRTLDRAFGGFFSGRILESLIIGFLALVVFYIIKMPYPPLLAVLLCIFNLIPYFGSIFAGVIGAVIVVVADPSKLLLFVVIDLLMEQIDSNILAPRVLGDTIGMHPLLIIVSITVMGNLFGVLGLIVGVPVAAVIIEGVEALCEKYEDKKQVKAAEVKNEEEKI